MEHVVCRPLLGLLTQYPIINRSLPNTFEYRATGARSSNLLQWLELKIVHQDTCACNCHNGAISGYRVEIHTPCSSFCCSCFCDGGESCACFYDTSRRCHDKDHHHRHHSSPVRSRTQHIGRHSIRWNCPVQTETDTETTQSPYRWHQLHNFHKGEHHLQYKNSILHFNG